MNVSSNTLFCIFVISIVLISLIGGVFNYIYNNTDEKTDKQSKDYAYGTMITCYTIAGILLLIGIGILLWNKFKGIDVLSSSDLTEAFVLEESLRDNSSLPPVVTTRTPYVVPVVPEGLSQSAQGTPEGSRNSVVPVVFGGSGVPVRNIQLLPGLEGASYLKVSDNCKDKLKRLNIEGNLTLPKYKSLSSDEKINVYNDCFKPNFVYETYPSGNFKNITRAEKLTDLQVMLSGIAFLGKNINSNSIQAAINAEYAALQRLSS